MAGVKGRSGGKNGGAGGRPRQIRNHSEEIKNGWLDAIREVAEEQGETFQKHVVKMLFDKSVQSYLEVGPTC